jgi:hypothetical protein
MKNVLRTIPEKKIGRKNGLSPLGLEVGEGGETDGCLALLNPSKHHE